MKKLLSLLLTFVFLNAQAMALSGGPRYDDQANVNLVGTYSGVLIPSNDSTLANTSSSNPSGENDSINSLGLFALGIPEAGPATGSFLIFSNGLIFSGTITAVGNPTNGQLNGLLDARYDYNLQTLNDEGDLVSIPVTAKVTGVLKATVEELNINTQDIQSILRAVQKIEGTADMGVNLAQVDENGNFIIERILHFTVDGVKQSSTVVTADFEAVEF